MALPTVGNRAIGEVRIGAGVRRRLTRRAFSYARQQNAPIIAADQAALRSAKRLRRSDVRSVKGATRIAIGEATSAAKGLRGVGLKGGYLREAGTALGNRAADLAATQPALTAAIRQSHASDIQGARSTVLSDRARLQQQGAEILQSELSSARTQGRSALKAEASATGAAAKKAKTHKRNVEAKHRGVRNAFRTGVGLLTSYGTQNIPQTEQQWQSFIGILQGQAAVSQQQARAAVRHMRRPAVLAGIIAGIVGPDITSAIGGAHPVPGSLLYKPPKKKGG